MYPEWEGGATVGFTVRRVALSVGVGRSARATTEGGLMLTVAEPVQHYKRVVGVLLLSARGHAIENAVRPVRLNILALFGIALAVTVLLLPYLSVSLPRPILLLAWPAAPVRPLRGPTVCGRASVLV